MTPRPIKVELVPHSPEWQQTAENEADRLKRALGDNLIRVHHIGSTSIPGICAKPILDLIPELRDFAAFDANIETIAALGYKSWGEFGIANRRYCTLEDSKTGKRLVQLHCFAFGDTEISRHLAFRDYMRAHPAHAAAYAAEKERCRDLYPEDSHAYSDAKSDWIICMEKIALDWATKNSG